MGEYRLRCPDSTILNISDAPFAWELFYQGGGIKSIKSRIYNIVQKLIILNQPVNVEFFKNFSDVDEIYIKDSGDFYEVNLKKTSTDEKTNMFVPVGMFVKDISNEDLWIGINIWLEYLEDYFFDNANPECLMEDFMMKMVNF